MSTKAIESMLKWVAQGGHPDVEQALTELEGIRKACADLSNEGIGDFVYEVRQRELLGWDGPRVNAWGNASNLVNTIAKEPK